MPTEFERDEARKNLWYAIDTVAKNSGVPLSAYCTMEIGKAMNAFEDAVIKGCNEVAARERARVEDAP